MAHVAPPPVSPSPRVIWAKLIDHTRCIGCHACTTACKSENEVPLGVTRTYVKSVDVGVFPHARRAFQVTRCNQCEDPPCVDVCPTGAMYQRPDGIVDFMKAVCIGCKACIAACPYDAIFINPEDNAAEKCNFCAHRLETGLEPACVVVCPTEAILVGDMGDPASKVSRLVQRAAVAVRRPEKDTRPKLFYRGAHQATLDPLAARRPGGGLYMWSVQGPDADGFVPSGHPDAANNSAAALLSYDVPHRAPWGWRVSLYTWTKGLAAGVWLVAAGLVMAGDLDAAGPLWRVAAPLLALAALAATGALLVADLKHPERFWMIFTRRRWRSWLVRGAFIIAAYGAVLGLHAADGVLGAGLDPLLLAAGVPLAMLTAAYTAYLFAQARARDLWQSPLLPPHLVVQSVLVGSAALAPVSAVLEPAALAPLLLVLAWASVLHVLLVWGETTLTHGTAHARLAVHEMTRGVYGRWFTVGVLAAVAAAFAPWLGPFVAAPLALAGVLAYEHAHVQAAQRVPLA